MREGLVGPLVGTRDALRVGVVDARGPGRAYAGFVQRGQAGGIDSELLERIAEARARGRGYFDDLPRDEDRQVQRAVAEGQVEVQADALAELDAVLRSRDPSAGA